ncbi:peptidyl-tRNA hydrolase PTH2-domain-containing protein [Gigaspora rosea]|uniref:peptidyl-tRNA hydrolase n=1 Tax=Gigaspora rosea TaxID=44941 RepID=A0A397VWZ6_9GLOM|nr:peptidyl-tRNA hydrolase PTH2-domain-containing protein [Gigaspora rosea]
MDPGNVSFHQLLAVVAIAAVSFFTGYAAGKQITKDRKVDDSDDSDDYDSDDSKTIKNSSIFKNSQINPDDYDEFKLVLLVRNDLGMTKGKVAAQCSHATLACYKYLVKTNPKLLKAWEYSGQPKIALKVKDEAEMLLLEKKARNFNLCARIIQDAGHTQVDPGSKTVMGIGPGPIKLINEVTGHLKLY